MKKSKFWLIFLLIFYLFIGFPRYSQGNTLETAGDILQIAIPAYALFYSLTRHDKKGTKEFFLGYTGTMATTYALKTLVREKRPNSKSYNSFPSGHTASAFSGATYLYKRYHQTAFEKIQGIVAFLAAELVGLSRVSTQHHYPHDVVFGAFLGISITYFFVHPSTNFLLESGVQSSPYIFLIRFNL